jgi:hypothetical protein
MNRFRFIKNKIIKKILEEDTFVIDSIKRFLGNPERNISKITMNKYTFARFLREEMNSGERLLDDDQVGEMGCIFGIKIIIDNEVAPNMVLCLEEGEFISKTTAFEYDPDMHKDFSQHFIYEPTED